MEVLGKYIRVQVFLMPLGNFGGLGCHFLVSFCTRKDIQ